MATSKSKEYIEAWEERVKLGQAFKEETGFSDMWDLYENYYKGIFGGDTQPINLCFPLVRSLVPRVYFRDPRVILTPLRPGFGVQSKILESIDNWILRQINLKGTIKTMIMDAAIYGTGVGKSGYDSEFGFSEERRRDASETEKFFQKAGYWPDNPKVTEYNETIMPGMPWYSRMSPRDVTFPYGCRSAKDTPWIVSDYVRHIDDVRADSKYSNTADLEPNRTIVARYIRDTKLAQAMAEKYTMDEEYVLLREVSDLRRKRVYVYAVGYDKWLRNDKDPLLSAGGYYDLMVFNEGIDTCWGQADLRMLDPDQRLVNKTNTMFAKNLDLHILRILVRAGVLSEADKKKLEEGDIGTFLELSTNEDLRAILTTFMPQLDFGFAQAIGFQRENAREVIGFSRNEAGQFDTSSRRTAYEASIVHNANQIRVDERRDAAADLTLAVLKRVNQYIFKYWSAERYAQVAGPEAAQVWVPYTGEMLRGDYYYQIDPDTTQQRSSEIRRQETMQVLQIIGSLPPQILVDQTGKPLVNFQELIKSVLDLFPSVDPMRVLTPASPVAPEGQVMTMQALNEKVNGGLPARQGGAPPNAPVQNPM